METLKYVAEKTDSALIIGDTKDRQSQFDSIADNDKALCGTLSIFKEGISHNPLSCVILGTPINNEPMLEQLLGRIQREMVNKKQPVVVDLKLAGYTVQNQLNNRIGHYMKNGYEIIQM